ncbi:MAG TPA: UDP-3-O-acyl-N-acetylglucosamine deacetylase [bacterium]|nr:UDP-3-O-acyl-N-acetylglucosamine deacetylase [bacterium]
MAVDLPNQKTIGRPFTFEGTGLHTGKKCLVKVSPLPAGSGLKLFRSDLGVEIPVTPFAVSSTARGTALSGEKNAIVHTVEHFLAAVQGLGITNLKVEMDGEEMPIMDGSSRSFCDLLEKAGTQDQGQACSPIRVTETIELKWGDVLAKAEPAEGLHLDVTTSFPYPGLEDQNRTFQLTASHFQEELASARTFCFEEEVEHLRRQGLIKGGSLECAMVFGKKGLLNGPARFEDEVVRHKTLDLLGDLTLLNRPLWAKVTVRKGGHRYHVELAKAILERFGKTPQNETSEEKMYDIQAIQKILPHRYPFLLVDRILELELNKRVVAIKNVTANEPFFQGHFPGHPIMPGVLVIEAMAQAGGVCFLIDPSNAGKILYLAGVDNARFRKPVLPGDQVRFEIEVLSLRSKVGKIHGKALVDGKVAVEAELTCAIVEREKVF